MKQRIITLVLLAGLVTMLAGCSETFNVKKGEQVRLTVLTDADPGTKTSYAGYTAGNTFERIRWETNDPIRIFSMNTDIVKAKWLDPNKNNDFYYYDYKISSRRDSADRYNKGTLTWGEAGAGEGYGMVWLNDPYGATLYGVYPSADTVDQGGKIAGFKNMTIPASQGAAPDMSHAYMISGPTQYDSKGTDQYGQSIPYMEMKFYPFFNAFYIELKSIDASDIKINSVTLTSTSNYLSGDYKYKFLEDNGIPAVGNVTYNMTASSNVTKSVTADLTSLSDTDRTATSSHAVGVTLLTLPPMAPYSDLTNMTLTVNYDNNKSKSLALNNEVSSSNPNGTPIPFGAFKKSRIVGMAMKGNKWKLTITTDVNDWTFYSKELSSLDQINVAPINPNDPDDKHTVDVTGGIETTNDWMTTEGYTLNGKTSSNHYLAAQGYDKYYQIRTLNWALPANKQYFEMSFTPTAPVGGYWMMVPEYVTPESEGHFRFEVVTQGVTSWENPGTQLKGQILGTKKVYIRIYPVNYGQEDINTYEMTLKCYFSPNVNFDPTYSSDSELQDIHGDGRFSYWRFRLTKYTGGPYAPGDPEHNSDKD